MTYHYIVDHPGHLLPVTRFAVLLIVILVNSYAFDLYPVTTCSRNLP